MSQIHVSRDGSSLGAFTPEQVREGLQSGQFKPTDFAWQQGMADWKPLTEWAEFTGPAPAPTLAPGAITQEEEIIEDGPPWEQRQSLGFFKALFETVKAVLLRPAPTFESMKQTGGYGSPILYGVLLSWIGTAATLLYQVAFNAGQFQEAFQEAGMEDIAMASGFTTGFVIGGLVLAPVMIIIWFFLWSGILHLSLMALSGAKASYEATFRTVAYGMGSGNILQIVPICGGLGGLWGMICVIIGISKVHDISIGKSILAYFLPTIVCCLLGGGIAFAIGIFGAAANQ